jgi:hypothetical protein
MLRQLSQFFENLTVSGALLVINFDKAPADHSLFVDDVSRGVRPSLAVRVQDPVAADYFVVFVFEKRKVEITLESLFEFLHKLFRIFVAVHADREDLYLLLFFWSQ